MNDNEVIKLFYEEENDLEYIELLSYNSAFGWVSTFFNYCKLEFHGHTHAQLRFIYTDCIFNYFSLKKVKKSST